MYAYEKLNFNCLFSTERLYNSMFHLLNQSLPSCSLKYTFSLAGLKKFNVKH